MPPQAAQNQELDTVEHPTLGTLKFPKDMSPDDRNESIQRVLMTRPDAQAPPGVPTPKQPMSQSPLGRIDSSDPDIPKFAGMHGGSYDIFPRANGRIADSNSPEMGAAALGGAIGVGADLAAPVVAPAARMAGKVIQKHPFATMIGIEGAKRLPVVGPVLDKVPGLEYLPFLAGKGEAPGVGRIRAIGAESAGEAEEAAASSRPTNTAKPSRVSPPREVARPSAPNPAIAPIETGEAAPAPTRIQKPSWTPPRASQFNTIEIGGPEDIAETRGIQEGIRDQADQETDALRKRGNEEGFSRNTRPRIGKGEMAKNFRSSEGSAVGEEPVKLTSTPSVKSGVAKPSAKASGKSSPRLGSGSETDDLTDLLEQSVRQAKAKKK